MTADRSRADVFAQDVAHAFALSGFKAPPVGEALILLVDTAQWATHADAAEIILGAEERHRAARLHFARDRLAYVLSHALWRTALGTCLGLPAADILIIKTVSGQPHLPHTAWATSLSHSGSWAAIALCAAATVGVDIERSPARVTLDELIATVCSPSEATHLEAFAASAREQALLALWTRKEALLKAFGVGLIEAPAMFTATAGTLITAPTSAPGQPACRAFELDLPTGLVGALAAPAPIASCQVLKLAAAPSR